MISGLVGSVSLQNNGGDTLTPTSDGSFTFNTEVAEGASYNVTVSSQPATQTCTVSSGSGTMSNSDVTSVQVDCVANTTTLSVSTTGTIPVGSGSGSLTITNTGTSYAATNVSVNLPSAWTGVTQDDTDCTSIAPNNGTCTISFTSTTPYIAQKNIQVTGDNISNQPTTALAFTVGGYVVWEVTNANTVQVIDSIDLVSPSPGIEGGGYGIEVGPTGQSFTDGATNTAAIVVAVGTGSSYPALLCYQSTNGSAVTGSWYLPALCQMGSSSSNCSSLGIANFYDNLVQLGFGDLDGDYWSSTEDSSFPRDYWWHQNIPAGGGGYQGLISKAGSLLGVRCARSLNY